MKGGSVENRDRLVLAAGGSVADASMKGAGTISTPSSARPARHGCLSLTSHQLTSCSLVAAAVDA